MIEGSVSPAGDPFSAVAARAIRAGSTRYHRVDRAFVELLHEDFGIPVFALAQAFEGAPPSPKKEALALCEWATLHGRDAEHAGELLRAWARKRGRGMYHHRIQGGPPLTFDGS